MSRSLVTVAKKGWFGIGPSVMPKGSGLAMMFFSACSFGM